MEIEENLTNSSISMGLVYDDKKENSLESEQRNCFKNTTYA